MSELESAAGTSGYRSAILRDSEDHGDFLVGASDLLMRTSQLVASGLDVEETLARISSLVLPYRGSWTELDVAEGVGMRRIDLADRAPRPTAGSELTTTLSSGAEILGTLRFFSPVGQHVFDDRDRQLAKDVAACASLAIMNARLVAARTQSEEQVRSIAVERLDFMSSLSHGLRTPLHAIHGYAQLLAEEVRGPLTEGQRYDVGRIQANESHLLQMLDSVIGYARWEDGEQLALEDLSVRDAVRLASPAVARYATEHQVIYLPDHEDIDAGLVVRAEPRRLREILLQLLLNAVKFSRPEGVVTVQALPVADCVWIQIIDTGIGIAAPHLESIFKPFCTTVRPPGEQANGVGLGLAITQRLARAMGGELSVVSTEGSGSTFTLALPRGKDL